MSAVWSARMTHLGMAFCPFRWPESMIAPTVVAVQGPSSRPKGRARQPSQRMSEAAPTWEEPEDRLLAMRRRPCLAVFALITVLPVLGGAGLPGSAGAMIGHDQPPRAVLPTLSSATFRAASDSGRGSDTVSGRISAPGGPYLYDSRGRIVFFHGVDAVYKYAPYELYPDPRKPWNFSAADASLMARLGFNVVRLGMTWSGLEPGTAEANDPAICGPARRGTRTSSTKPSSTGTSPTSPRPSTCWGASTSTRSWTCTKTCTTRCSKARAPRLGRLHGRRPERRPAGTLVPRVRHPGRRHRLQPLLAQQRARRSAGPVRPGLGRRGARLQGQPLGPRLRPVQRAVLHVADPLR